ncbi:MAG: TetR/AcrR family transcriptional regulator [Bacteroidales bacterium]
MQKESKDKIISVLQEKFKSRKGQFQKHVQDTKDRLLNAVTSLVRQDGFNKLGINAIAKEAGCDKVLIYRYFGGMANLLQTWALKHDFYVNAYDKFGAELSKVKAPEDLKKIIAHILTEQLRIMREDKLMQELILWEVSAITPFSTLREIREKNANLLKSKMKEIFPKIDIENFNMYLSLLIISIDFIVIYTRHVPMINGINFAEKASYEKLNNIIPQYMDMIFDQLNTEKKC